jgi:tRNA(Ile)-lysidine synthase
MRAMSAASPHLPDWPLAAPAPLCVAFSGGLDSTVLLHLLAADPARRGHGLRAVHVDHGLHPDSPRWARHCHAVCASLDLPLVVERVVVERNLGSGPEAAARIARHAAFARTLGEGEVLALAHQRDDQAETFLLRALRASGPDGLAAMRPLRRFGRGWLWRPLLHSTRAQLRDFAHRHALPWIEDPGNAGTDLDRNFLRHRIMPLLRERWPQADAGLARSAALAAGAASLLDAADSEALAAVATPDAGILSRPKVRALPAERRARVLRRWIAALGLPPLPGNGVARIEAEVLDSAADAAAAFAWSGAIVRAWRDQLHAGWLAAPLPTDWDVAWDGRAPLPLPGGGALELLAAGTPVIDVRVRARHGGERIRQPGRSHSHALKHVLQDLGVPPWERARLPLLFSADGELLAAGDLACSNRFAQWLHASGARLAWRRHAGR